jgi:beta-glucanase (GH16 family)
MLTPRAFGCSTSLSWFLGSFFFSFYLSLAQAQTYRLVWEDEFNQFDPTTPSSSPNYNRWDLDRSIWNVEVVDTPFNNEIQQYRDTRDNLRLELDPGETGDGMLVIESRRQNTTQNLGAWTSGRINSKGKLKFKYGLVEVRAKLPLLLGSWPAIWMLGDNIDTLGWPSCGEIDIMEMGRVTGWNSILGTIHWQAPGGYAYVGSGNSNANLAVPDCTSAFHVYRIEWTPTEIRWYVDGTLYYTQEIASITGSPANPFTSYDFHLLLNNAMGGNMGGTVDTSGPASTRYEIDYVRVYQKQPVSTNNTILTSRPALRTNSLSLPSGITGSRVVEFSNYPHAVSVSGSVPGMTLSVTQTATPFSGFAGSSGKTRILLAGTPTQVGTFNLQIQATNIAGGTNLTLPVVVSGNSYSLQNGGFEISSGGIPAGWSGSTNTTNTILADTISSSVDPLSAGWTRSGSVAGAAAYELATASSVYYGSSTLFVPYSGSASLKVYGPYMGGFGAGTTRLSRTTNAVAGDAYRFQAYAHTGTIDAIRGGNVCRLFLEFLNSSGTVLATHYSTAQMDASSPRGTWTLFQTAVVTAPAGTASARIGSEFIQPSGWSGSDSNGCVYWDEFQLNALLTYVGLTSNASGQALRLFPSGYMEQTISAEPDAFYLLSGSNAAGSGSLQARITYQNDAGTTVGSATSSTFSSGQSWQLSSTCPSGATRAVLRLSQGSGTVDVNGVDWALQKRVRLFNAGAETVESGLPVAWQTFGTTSNSAGVVSSGAQAGSSALRVAGPSTSSNNTSGWTQTIAVSSNGIPWLAEVWSRNSVPLAGSNRGLLRLEFLDSAGSVLLTGDSELPKSSSYSKSRLFLRAPTNSTQARISLLLNPVANASGELLFDSADLRSLSPSDYLVARAEGAGISSPNLTSSADPDGDGVTSADEFIWGTDPYAPSSVTSASPSIPSANLFRLQWLAVPGMSYQIDRFDSLSNLSAPTQTISISPSTTTGSTSNFTAEYDFPITNSKAFFRIRPE